MRRRRLRADNTGAQQATPQRGAPKDAPRYTTASQIYLSCFRIRRRYKLG